MCSITSGPRFRAGAAARDVYKRQIHVHAGEFVSVVGLNGAGQYKVHDLENLGDKEMVFMTIEFLNSCLLYTSRCV